MTIDEIAKMPDKDCILFIRGLNPFYSEKFKLDTHPNYKLLYEANEDHYFDSAMGVKMLDDDRVVNAFNMRSPDQGLEERKEDIKIVSIEDVDELEKQMDAVL